MDHFEKTALQRQPYLSMDVSTIISYEEIETTFDGIISDKLRIFAKHIYQHWKDTKVAREGRAIIPVLKVCCRTSFNKILVAKFVSSLSKEMKRMTATHTFVLDDVKFDRSERPEERMLKAPIRLRNFGKNLILHGILSKMSCSVRLCVRLASHTKLRYLSTGVR
jgi:hypothetical protein